MCAWGDAALNDERGIASKTRAKSLEGLTVSGVSVPEFAPTSNLGFGIFPLNLTLLPIAVRSRLSAIFQLSQN